MDFSMIIDEHYKKMKDIEEKLLKYLECEDENEENYENLINSIKDKRILEDQHEAKILLYLLIKIANSHHRNFFFFDKIEQVLKAFKEEIKKNYSNSVIFKVFKDNKMILLFLIEEKLIEVDEDIFQEIMTKKFQYCKYPEYFAPEIKPFIEKELQHDQNQENQIYIQEIKKIYNEDLIQFNEKRKIGENDGLIYQIIRKDLIEEFIIYVNKENYLLDCNVERSIFETNPFLLNQKEVTLIEYAAFFGSVQIFKYLYKNKVKLTKSLWIFAIHGQNEEIIHILEENKIKLSSFDLKDDNSDDDSDDDSDDNSDNDSDDDDSDLIDKNISYQRCLKECIKCHHNYETSYIIENYFNEHEYKNFLTSYCFQYYNFLFLPEEMNNNEIFFYACKSDDFKIVHLLLNNKKIDVNTVIISKNI